MRLVTSCAAAAALVAFSFGSSLLASPIVFNPGFEIAQYAIPQGMEGVHTVNPTDTGVAWTFTPSTVPAFVAAAGSGIDRANPYGAINGVTNSDPNSGTQMAFIQGSGDASVMSISQSISGFDVGTQYKVSFYAKAINGFAGANPFVVSVGATTLTFGGPSTITPPTTSGYALYTSDAFTASASTATLSFADQAPGTVAKVSWIDDVSISTVGVAAWSALGSGDWNAAGGSNWTVGVPNAIDAEADFTGSITSNSTVYTNSNVTVGTMKFNSGFSYLVTGQGTITLSSATTALINVVSGSHALAPRKLEFASDTTVTVASGASLTLAGLYDGIVIDANKHVTTSGTVNFNSPVTLQTGSHLNLASSSFAPSLTMAASAAATLATHSGSTPSVLQVNSLSVDPAASLQLNNNALLVHGGSLNSIETAVGNGSIATSLATSDASGRTALGVAIAGDVGLTGTTIGGATLAASDVLVKPTYYGDANLSGTVDGADYTRIDAGYGSNGSLKGWENGDFNHDGLIDGSDYSLIDGSFGAALTAFPAAQIATPAASIAGPVSVPEPTTMGLLALGASALLGRRTRRSK